MDNNELSIQQLQTISGGGVFAKLDGFKADRISPLSDGKKKTDLMAERTIFWLAPLWSKVKAVTQAKSLFG
ncbi:CCRG-2 family RiPP [Prochlorococcus marinus]|uniref:CCRG-2 family RiPP n=1 Tax=Prochlorococcus marinus TaxID=1219 RepID=UPI001F3F40F0|nr:CCRG-2 family RiPP [Prochlorococcus marinus]